MRRSIPRPVCSSALAIAALIVLVASPARSQSRCQALKYQIAGMAAQALARCKARAIEVGGVVDPECLTRATERLANRWAKAEKRDDCLTTDDADAVRGAVDTLLADLAILLEPPPARCCQQGSTCLYFPTPADCVAFIGTPGEVIDRCDAVTGSCLPQESGLGECCQLDASHCLAGLNLFNCGDFGGRIVFNATCLPSGLCGTP